MDSRSTYAGPARLRLACLRDERGIALVMVLGMLLVLTIASAAALSYSSSGTKSSSASNSRQKAFDLAEAGVNNALAVLFDANDPMDPNAVGSGSQTAEGGTFSYSGSLSGTTWTVTGTGTISNPATGGTITRQTQTKRAISTSSTPWAYLFSDSTGGCMHISNNATISAPLYVRGDLCLDNNSHFTGSDLLVGGTLTVNNGASVGYTGTPINAAHVALGCKKGGGPHACTSADDVYAGTIDSTTANLSKPTLDLAKWYARAAPGPMKPCTSGSVPGNFDDNTTMNGSRATFNLASGAAYDCRVTNGGGQTIGRITWTPGSPGTLVVAGVIFFDGNIQVSDAVYQGRATIYSFGTVTLGNNVHFCGVGACDATWNPQANQIVLVAGSSTAATGFTISNNAVYQGATYAATDYSLANNAVNWGPVIARNLSIANNSGSTLPLNFLAPGAPGIDGEIQGVPNSWNG